MYSFYLSEVVNYKLIIERERENYRGNVKEKEGVCGQVKDLLSFIGGVHGFFLLPPCHFFLF